ncbi:hypothetical protein BJY01DRAFT_217592 [Aspergillus pseudoustus]|uniref:HMG box domain-containing protein n=1 Tax=Aspergillus pseudoustus TaxID=1810923 RepID=A0ABR4JQY4_9EURO
MPKDDSKSKDGTVTVNVEEFTKTRDSVLASLAQLQAAAFELSRAYINHTNTVLGQDAPNDLAAFTNLTASLRESGLLGPAPSTAGAGDDKRKRKRAKPDPNAPKRALTPFFLYMKHNRQALAKEMGSKAKRNKDVSDEGARRWAEMPDTQKEIWKKMYADNLATYREQVAAYKAGKTVDGDDQDQEKDQAASQLQGDVEAAQQSGEESESEEEEEEEEEESPEPAKEPTPPPSKRRRSEGKPSKEASSPVKKRGAKKEEPPKPPASETKRNKKKRKSDIGGDA